jgi:uncharacterized protein (DUF433 family)
LPSIAGPLIGVSSRFANENGGRGCEKRVGLQWQAASPRLSGVETSMKTIKATERVELGEYIVADPDICHGKPTFKGTRVMVWVVLEQLADGLSFDDIVKEWRGRVPREAIAEAAMLASEVMKLPGFPTVHDHPRRKPAREPSRAAA